MITGNEHAAGHYCGIIYEMNLKLNVYSCKHESFEYYLLTMLTMSNSMFMQR